MVSKIKKIRVRSHKIQLICMHDASHTYNNIMMPKKVQYLWGQPTIMLLTRCKHISASVQCRWWWWKMGFAYLHCDCSLSLFALKVHLMCFNNAKKQILLRSSSSATHKNGGGFYYKFYQQFCSHKMFISFPLSSSHVLSCFFDTAKTLKSKIQNLSKFELKINGKFSL